MQEQVGHAFASTTAIYTSVSNDFKTKTLQAALKRVYAPPGAAVRGDTGRGMARDTPTPTSTKER